MRHGAFTAWAATASIAAVSAFAGDPASPAPDPYAAALAKARAVEQQLATTVATVCQSSVAVLNSQFPPDVVGKPRAAEPQVMFIGSGVLVTRGGKTWILTNHHVIEGQVRLDVVTCDGVTRRVELVDEVQKFDIALLRFADARTSGLKAVPVVGKKGVELEEGQWCIATGNPFGLAMDGVPVVSLGVVSGKDRVLGGNLTYGRAIQHDAAINHGNSGGPLWNARGEFVGINGMMMSDSSVLAKGQEASNQGASFSIPVEEVDAFLGQLIDAKKDARAGFLGVDTETETDRAGKPVGARVVGVEAGGPAGSGAKALQAGDVIDLIVVAADDKRFAVRTSSDLMNALALLPAGTKISVSYRRSGSAARWTGELGVAK